jgi:hypothetical protein
MTRKIVFDVVPEGKPARKPTPASVPIVTPPVEPKEPKEPKGPIVHPRDPNSNKSKRRAAWAAKHSPRPYDDPGETLWIGERHENVRVRLFQHTKRRFLELRIERLIDGEWCWTQKGCSIQQNEIDAVVSGFQAAKGAM